MNESKILDTINAITLGKLSFEEQAIIVADIKSTMYGKRFAGNINELVMSKINDMTHGLYKESNVATSFQDFNEVGEMHGPMTVFGIDQIHKFLDKMVSTKYEGEYFQDEWPFYHPVENFTPDGVPRHYSDFISNTNKQ